MSSLAVKQAKAKKKRLSMAIPDENASLQDRLSQMHDTVGPHANQKAGPRVSIWDDSKSLQRENATLDKMNANIDKVNFATTLREKSHRSSLSCQMFLGSPKPQQGSSQLGAQQSNGEKTAKQVLMATENLETENGNSEFERFKDCNTLKVNEKPALAMSHRCQSTLASPTTTKEASRGGASQLSSHLHSVGAPLTAHSATNSGSVAMFRSMQSKHTGDRVVVVQKSNADVIKFYEQSQIADRAGDTDNLTIDFVEEEDEDDEEGVCAGDAEEDRAEKAQSVKKYAREGVTGKLGTFK